MSMLRVAVIGGGASGLLCAGYAARAGCQVTVIETRERPARKILVTGKGRCNVTNNCTVQEFFQNVRTNPKFLYSALNAFPPQSTIEFFEQLGVPLKTERGRRVFPVSDRAMDIADALVRFCREGGAVIQQGKASELEFGEDGRLCAVNLKDGRQVAADAVVLAAGGMSYPATGSDGSGYTLAEMAGHTITPLRPSLVPIVCRDGFCSRLMGLSLKNVTLTLRSRENGKILFSELGEMLFTHFGVSGPLVLSASSYMQQEAACYELSIDFKPALSAEQLDARILRDFSDNPNKELAGVLGLLLPKSIIPVILRLLALNPKQKINQITRVQREKLVQKIKDFPLAPARLGDIEEAVITAGGVSVQEVDPKTMRSKKVRNLFFAGEILDVDAYTGGYNLQIAFSTGYAAAQGVRILCEEKRNEGE